MKIGKGKNGNISPDDINEKFENFDNELNNLMEIITKNSARLFSVETLLRKLNTEEFLTNKYQVKTYARVCQLALSDKKAVEYVSKANMSGETFRQVIEMVANSVESKTTDENIVDDICSAIRSEGSNDY